MNNESKNRMGHDTETETTQTGGCRFIHIAGTNGKGSTATYLAGILGVSHRCGLFTSPHIFSPLERFRINGEKISQADYDAYIRLCKGDPAEHWFGVWTRMALQWFADNNVSYAVIETGLGGRKDQTNVVESVIQVITPISFDHTAELGSTIQKIAREKCGIIKWGATVISHPQQPEVLDVVKKTCERMNAQLIVLDENTIKVHNADIHGQTFDFRYDDLFLKSAHINAISSIQVQNACVAAIAAFELGIPSEDILEGLRETTIPARTQYADGILVDVAHNAAAMRKLAQTVKRYFPKKDITVLCAVMEDKDIPAIAAEISSFADSVFCTCADKKRGLPAKEFQKFFDNAQADENPAHALMVAQSHAQQKKGTLVVCGSFYLAPYALEQIEN